jgi:DNA-binding SARP family transcriptional activator/tetratricopeptide (TPR) repeat protein
MGEAHTVRFRVLGPMEVEVDGETVPVPGGRRHAVLAALLVAGPGGLSQTALAEMFEADEPDTGESTVRSWAARVRAWLGTVDPTLTVEHRAEGYVLDRGAARVDADEFTTCVAQAREAMATGDHRVAAAAAASGLALWRGRAFGAAAHLPIVRTEAARLDELRLQAHELHAAALLELGRGDEVTGELLAAIEEAPEREELRRLLMLALARADRHVEALRAYESFRLHLVEVGAVPSSRLRSLEQRIVRQDPSLAAPDHTTGPGRWALPAELATTSDLVGREEERAVLASAVTDAASGGHGLVVVSGEAGAGKSHLVSVVAQEARAAGAIVLYGACDETIRAPFGPFVRALRFFREQGAGWADDVLAPWWPELVRLVPEARPRRSDETTVPLTDPQTEVLQLLDAIVGWLGAASQPSPVVLVLEDLQWATEPTLLTVKRLVTSNLAGVLVLATIRDPEPGRPALLDEVLQAARRAGSLRHELALGGLSADEVLAMTNALRDDLGADEDFARSVTEVTSGNPLFVTELVGDLASPDLPADRATLPSAGHLVARRLRQVDAAVAEVLAEAAIVGADIPLDLLIAASSSDAESVLRAIDTAIDAGLLVYVPDPRQRLRFAHAVVREALVDQLGRAERVAIHRRVAAALLALPDGARAPYIEDLARHAYEASLVDGPSVAIGPIVRAGDAALEQRAYRHAADWYGRALELADRGGVDPSNRFSLLASMGDAQRRAGDPAFRTSILDAAELARAEGDGAGLARAALIGSRGYYRQTAVADHDWIALLEEAVDLAADAPPATRALLLASLAAELVWDDTEGRRFGLSDEAVALARQSADASVLAQVLVLRLTTIWSPGRLDDCWSTAEEAIAVTEAVGDRALCSHALRFAAGAALERGDRATAMERSAVAEALTDEAAQPDLHWHLSLARASWALLDGDLDRAVEEAQHARQVGEAIGEPEALAFFSALDFEIRRVAGRLTKVMAAIAPIAHELPPDPSFGLLRDLAAGGQDEVVHPAYRAAVADLGAITQGVHTVAAYANLAFLAHRFADDEAAEALHELMAPWADHHPHAIVILPVGHHHLGLLAATRGRSDQAEEHFAAALVAHQGMGARLHEAETHLEWGRHLARGEPARRKEADRHLAAAREIALELGAHGLVEPV